MIAQTDEESVSHDGKHHLLGEVSAASVPVDEADAHDECPHRETSALLKDLHTFLPPGVARAVRGIYDDTDSISRRPWLLQPVLQAGPASMPSTSSRPPSRPASAARFRPPRPSSARRCIAGAQAPQAGQSPLHRGRPSVPRPMSARRASISAAQQYEQSSGTPRIELLPQQPFAGPSPVEPVLTSGQENVHSDGSQVDRLRPWRQRPQSATGRPNALSPPQQMAAEVLAMLATETPEEQEARRIKQEKIRAWLQRKEAEVLKQQQAEEEEARKDQEKNDERQRKKQVRDSEEQRKRASRIMTAQRRKQEIAQEVKRACEGRGPWSKASLESALATYGKTRPTSARGRVR